MGQATQGMNLSQYWFIFNHIFAQLAQLDQVKMKVWQPGPQLMGGGGGGHGSNNQGATTHMTQAQCGLVWNEEVF